jgi:ribonuclease P protein component
MGSASACGHGAAAPCSRGAEARAGRGSRRSRRQAMAAREGRRGRTEVQVERAGSEGAPPRSWERLRRAPDIRRAMRAGLPHVGGRVVLYVLPRKQGTRVAFVSGRRVGKAVGRNRARRLMREAWRVVAPGLQGGFDIVFVARPEIEGAGMGDVLADIGSTLSRAGVIAR